MITSDNLPVEISLSLVMKIVHKESANATAAELEANKAKIMQLVTDVN